MTQPRNSGGTPAADAFYFPADGCRQARLWLPWPEGDPLLQGAIAAVARAAAEFQPVSILGGPAAFGASSGIEIIAMPHSAPRLRDTGPTFLVDGKGGAAAVDWRFDGWGRRGGDGDAGLAHALLGAAEVRRFRAPLTLEGSSIAADGRGTVMALASAVFDPARNPGVTRLEAFGIFQAWLGAACVIWLAEAHPKDAFNTDLRTLAAFVAPGAVAITAAETPPPPGSVAAQLAHARDAQGRALDLIALPAPAEGGGARSYTNFLPLNGGVLAPAFGGPGDARAADILAEVFPGRVIQLVPAEALAAAGVSLSGLALTQPARLLERDRVTVLPRSAWAQPTADAEELLQKYIDLANRER